MDGTAHLSGAAQEGERRRRRQAEALRANLRKRKDQAERRGALADDALDAPPPVEDKNPGGPDEGK